MSPSARSTVDRRRPLGWCTERIDRRTAIGVSLVVGVQVLLVALYFAVTNSTPESVRYLVYPFVWINLGGWAVYRTRRSRRRIGTGPKAGRGWIGRDRRRLLVAAIAGLYLVGLLALSGLVSLSGSITASGLGVQWVVPGWGPIVAYVGSILQLYFVPFRFVGYLAIAYLVYANLLLATRGSGIGLLAALSCVGCATPVVAQLVGTAGVAGGTAASVLYGFSNDLGTLIFLVTVAILLWSHERYVERTAIDRS